MMTGHEPISQVLLEISGRVQMVGFRYYAQRQAQKMGITGYVRNMPNGSVEISAEGPRDILDRFISAMKEGPPSAVVHRVLQKWRDENIEHYTGFTIRW